MITSIEQFLEQSAKATLLRFSTAGSVDDGKSTLIGRLLHDSKNILEDQLTSLKQRSNRRGSQSIELALVTDGLKAEQEQGITIDVAYRYFSTPKRRFILADSPGHEQYTRNMATGASTADLTIILVDAAKGILTQTKRHSFIASLMGVPRLLVAINKMDSVDFSEKVFESIKSDYIAFAEKLGIRDVRFIPVSALVGDNIVERSENMPWYQGETLLEYLENVYNQSDANLVDFRFPVQYVINPNAAYRGYAGQVASGVIRVGDEVIALPSMKKSKVKSIDLYANSKPSSLTEARPPQSVVISLEDQIDVGRGDLLVRPGNPPKVETKFEAMLVWMNDQKLDPGKAYIIRHTTRETKVFIDEIKYRVDINELKRTPGAPLEMNEIGRVALHTASPLFLDVYKNNRSTGNFILIDPDSYQTAAAGLVLDHFSHDLSLLSDPPTTEPKSQNLHQEISLISRAEREQAYGHAARTYWFTGLSGSGKSTIAKALEKKFFDRRAPVYRLDGDNLRTGLNRDLDFSATARTENLRRTAEVAKLFNDAGISVICSFISPSEADRLAAKEIIGAASFTEVYLSTPLSTCESRDPHNLYKKARSGEIKNFTGISAPYEVPKSADLVLDTSTLSVPECISKILEIKPA